MDAPGHGSGKPPGKNGHKAHLPLPKDVPPLDIAATLSGKRVLFANGSREWDGKAAHALFEALLK
jgi:hypothetical protein